MWDVARDEGFEVIVHERGPHRGEKRVDTELVARGSEIIAGAAQPMVLVLASGDQDYVPLIDVAHRHDWEVEDFAFASDFDPKGELATAAGRVQRLDELFPQIGYHAFEWPEENAPS